MGTEQADRYIIGLFEAFEKIEMHGVTSRPVPAAPIFASSTFHFRPTARGINNSGDVIGFGEHHGEYLGFS